MTDISSNIKQLRKSFDIFKERLSNTYDFNDEIFQLNPEDRQAYIDELSSVMDIAIFLKKQIENGEIIPLEADAHCHTTDIHGDLLALGFVLLKSGLAKFVDGELPVVFFNKTNGEIIKDIGLYGGSITIDLVPILNLEVNGKFNGRFTFGGDMVDRGRYSESCYQTYMRLIYNNRGKKIDFIIGNHETPALETKKEDVILCGGSWKNPLLAKMNPYLHISDLRLQSRNLIMFHEDIRRNVELGKIILCSAVSEDTLISHAVFIKSDIKNLVKKIGHIIYTNRNNQQKSEIIEKMRNVINIFQSNRIIERLDGSANLASDIEMEDLTKHYRVNTVLNTENIENAMNEYIKIFHDIVKNFDNFLSDEQDFPRVKTVINGTLKHLIDEKTNSIIPVENRIFNPETDMLTKKVIAGHEETPRYNDGQSNDVICLISSDGRREFLYTDVRQSSGCVENEDITNAAFIYSDRVGVLNSYRQISVQIPTSTIPRYIELINRVSNLYNDNSLSGKIVEKDSKQLLIP